MNTPLHFLLPLLRCPDDGGELSFPSEGLLRCALCRRQFPATGGDMVSLVGLQPGCIDTSPHYQQDYLAARQEMSPVEGWRLPEPAFKFKRRQVRDVATLLGPAAGDGVVCDFSAGPGYYTLEYARTWRWVIHCDLCLAALEAVRRSAHQQGLTNILFVRMDYFRPPFSGSLQRILCLDTLARGERHEQALLRAILHSLAPAGNAIVDFHNWWHNPLRRMGLLPDNYIHNRSYARHELAPLLHAAGIARYECFPFYQELDTVSSLVTRILPPTRWMYRFTHAT
jgi:SAM-dependent methyltransferase